MVTPFVYCSVRGISDVLTLVSGSFAASFVGFLMYSRWLYRLFIAPFVGFLMCSYWLHVRFLLRSFVSFLVADVGFTGRSLLVRRFSGVLTLVMPLVSCFL